MIMQRGVAAQLIALLPAIDRLHRVFLLGGQDLLEQVVKTLLLLCRMSIDRYMLNEHLVGILLNAGAAELFVNILRHSLEREDADDRQKTIALCLQFSASMPCRNPIRAAATAFNTSYRSPAPG